MNDSEIDSYHCQGLHVQVSILLSRKLRNSKIKVYFNPEWFPYIEYQKLRSLTQHPNQHSSFLFHSIQVTVRIVCEAQARRLYQRDNPQASQTTPQASQLTAPQTSTMASSSSSQESSIETCGEILNNKGTMEYHPSRRHLIAPFR